MDRHIVIIIIILKPSTGTCTYIRLCHTLLQGVTILARWWGCVLTVTMVIRVVTVSCENGVFFDSLEALIHESVCGVGVWGYSVGMPEKCGL